MKSLRRRVPAAACAFLVACTPALNWRETRSPGLGVEMLFPCRPERHERIVRLAHADVRMEMLSCDAGDATFSLVLVDAAGPAGVKPLLGDLRAAAVGNVNGTASPRALVVPGATPNEGSVRLRIEGRLPDGRRVVENTALFVKGLRVYQASALGDALDAESLETFFGAIKVVP